MAAAGFELFHLWAVFTNFPSKDLYLRLFAFYTVAGMLHSQLAFSPNVCQILFGVFGLATPFSNFFREGEQNKRRL